VEDFAGELFGGYVHFLLGLVVEGYGAVFVEGEAGGGGVALLDFGGGEAEPAVVYAEDDFVGAHFDYGVVGAVEAVGGCVAAEQGGPGGPEFGVEAGVQ
jgi:hypothetical protein